MSAQNTCGCSIDFSSGSGLHARREGFILWIHMDTHRIDNPYSGETVAERRFLTDALARHHGNVSRAAEEMGMYRQHLQLKLVEHKIDPATFRRRLE